MVISTPKSHLRSPSLSWEGTPPCHGLPSTQQGSPLLTVTTPGRDSPVHGGADTEPSHHTGSLQAHPRQCWRCTIPAWGAGVFSLTSRNWVLQAISVGVDTKLITAAGMRQRRQQGRNEIEEYAFAL